MKSEQNVNELVEMLDRLMSEGSGHVNVISEDGGEMTVQTCRSSECGKGGQTPACCQPTLHKGIDEDE